MGCNCTKGTRANDNVENDTIINNVVVKERRRKPNKTSKKKKKKFVSSTKDNNNNVGSEGSGNNNNNNNNNNDSTLRLLIPIADAKNNDEVLAEKKVNLERKSSRSLFQRRPTNTDVVGNNKGTLQQPMMSRICSISNGERGAQVMAGWPSWLASVAGEAINGWIPRKADSFEKLEKIGQGTYSSVYKARDLETNQLVALKKVRFANSDPDSVRFMAREIIILRRLDHPNVMKLEGLITSRVSGSMYLIFEYMEHDLAGLASTPGVNFSEAQIKCYMKQLLHGLEHCHSRGVLHRDIKGSNLLLDQSNNLKIGDFGLANFYGSHQKQPLTSRVVTLWYRPPELLLGSTDYGVTVDLWSTGCILAELFNGKPIMPGRTEVEQLHKIFKLCGSPSEEYWKKSKLPHATIFKPQQPYKRCVAESFKSLPSSALALVEVLLAVEPNARGTTDSALQSEFFTTKPFASDPSSLPKYQPRKETDVKAREEEAKRKKGTSSKQNESKQVSKGASAPDANAELLTSIQKREKFNPDEDAARYRIEPLKSGTPQVDNTRYGVSSVNRYGENVLRGSSRSPRKELRTQRSFVQRGASQLSRFSNSVAARDGSHFAIANPRWLEDSYNNNRQNDGDWSQRFLVKPKGYTKHKENIPGYGEKTERMHYSGPLVSAGGNLNEMLKEHERQIQVAVRKARAGKKKHRGDNG
ncbi:PREDICTED: probable serine/threonine-protein kinase At1g09600 [Camelina sativa]|uniref:Probable serine/threonine-protein kinase At1g09600 n=1 Tax=Camelina sativa TaxID=90675 RepID=A0ABM0WT66_CAMSA|nr:PREDICTED: probable serine/threonine-protein kinase At1g09600 [Camelina sativa]